ncbi:hypothetical protein HKD37_08G022056 [Glycine soja]|uniref:Uncharacterized protein n=1 Tax=Glycine soja TaxID=3848 RepID=A0A0B2QNV2_GLYSO|nr:hypothetical protein JHK87_021484 [Glycine soja]KAG5025667.1 hypothetical protein JHK86_021581 [Glycine max]KAH1051571.1 hypothetical protein GYH30_021459 [Glycine max]KHN21387.1 hypothetical protein glysoja_026588 [Glycine soja]
MFRENQLQWSWTGPLDKTISFCNSNFHLSPSPKEQHPLSSSSLTPTEYQPPYEHQGLGSSSGGCLALASICNNPSFITLHDPLAHISEFNSGGYNGGGGGGGSIAMSKSQTFVTNTFSCYFASATCNPLSKLSSLVLICRSLLLLQSGSCSHLQLGV